MIFTRKTSNKKPSNNSGPDMLDGLIDGLLPKNGSVATNKAAAIATKTASGVQAPQSTPKYFSALNVAAPTTGNSSANSVGSSSQKTQDQRDDDIWAIIDELTTKDDAGRKEYADQLAQSSAEATENARAQTGLAGMALSGAGAAAVGAQERKGARESALALKQFDDAELDKLISGIELSNSQRAADSTFNTLENEMPLRGDYPAGAEGTAQYNADLDTWKQNQETDKRTTQDLTKGKDDVEKSLNKSFGDSGLDYSLSDAAAETGSKEKPFFVDDSWKQSDLESYLSDIDSEALPLKTEKVGNLTFFVDQYGHYYFLPSMHKNQSYFDFS